MQYPPIDSEVISVQEKLFRALLDLHRNIEHESFFWLWAKEYRIRVAKDLFVISPVRTMDIEEAPKDWSEKSVWQKIVDPYPHKTIEGKGIFARLVLKKRNPKK